VTEPDPRFVAELALLLEEGDGVSVAEVLDALAKHELPGLPQAEREEIAAEIAAWVIEGARDADDEGDAARAGQAGAVRDQRDEAGGA
jgi:hypothetical protein